MGEIAIELRSGATARPALWVSARKIVTDFTFGNVSGILFPAVVEDSGGLRALFLPQIGFERFRGRLVLRREYDHSAPRPPGERPDCDRQKRIASAQTRVAGVVLAAVGEHPEMGLRTSIQGFSAAVAAAESDSSNTRQNADRELMWRRILTHFQGRHQ
jgi:hypothetical protein